MALYKFPFRRVEILLKSKTVKKLSACFYIVLNLYTKAKLGLLDSPDALMEACVSGAKICISTSQPSFW